MTTGTELIEAARGGAPDDVEALIADVWPHAFRIASSILHDRALAEDAAQEACANVYLAIARLRRTEAFDVWFYRIVVREALAVKRRSPSAVAPSESSAGFACELDRCDERLDVRAALERLSPVQRAAVVLHFYAGLNSREIARILRIPDSSVRFHLVRARRALERTLAGAQSATPPFAQAVAGAL
jgi:RNA polymerase sigma-70 factor (ECF subfamily)